MVTYQIYVRSFADGDGDGVGDLRGVASHLDDLVTLGVDALWLTPIYASPQEDHGYDVADPRAVDPLFGDLADLDALVSGAHRRGLRLLLDLVPNHTSAAHAWFQAALAAAPGSPERARYLFRDGRGAGGANPPNDWVSLFGGPAWERVRESDGRPGQWYLHLFAPGQPDLDWSNSDVGDDAEATLRFWLDRGVDGFRVDVAHGLVKAEGLPDDDTAARRADATFFPVEGAPMWDQPGVHDIYRRWRSVLDSYDGDRCLVGELWVRDPDRHASYVRPDELHLAFAFPLLEAPLDAGAWRAAITASLAATVAVGSPATWVLGNHDVVRIATRLGGLDAARAATLALLALPGPVFLYQGDELGLPGVTVAPDARQDPIWERSGHTVIGRDGCRVPLPWSGEAPPYGFSTGTPWLPQPGDWGDLTAVAQATDPLSTLVLVRGALAVRRALLGGGLTWREGMPAGVLAFDRPGGGAPVTCVLNTATTAATVDVAGRLVLASTPVRYDGASLALPPRSCVWLSPAG